MGLGCWAIGGHFTLEGKPDGWGNIDDAESIWAIHAALDLGINLFDTADVYGTGHSERILGKALAGRREQVVVATKFGFVYNETTKEVAGSNVKPEYVRWACDQSLRRLGTDYIDIYQLHCGVEQDEIEPLLDTLDELVQAGKIRAYAPSSTDIELARRFAVRPNCASIQHELSMFADHPAMLELCETEGLASLNSAPLAYGFLTGKFNADSRLSPDDFRAAGHVWVRYFEDGRPKQTFLDRLDRVKAILTSDGRSLVQGALGWIWGRSERTLPIPGFKTVKQVQENAKAMEYGPLSQSQLDEINRLIGSI